MVDWTPAERIQADAYRLRGFIQDGAYAEALGMCHRIREDTIAVTTELVYAAINSGMTKKRVADILDISPGTLRDVRRTGVRA